MSFTVEYRLRDWSDWSTEVQHLPIDDQIAHSNPINDLFPDPEHGLSYAPPQLTPASPRHSSPTTDKKNVASPPKPFQHLFWGSPGTKAQPAMQDPLLHNYPIDLPRDVVSAYAHVMSHPTTLSPSVLHARPSPHAPPRASHAVPLAPATNWPPPDPWQQPQPQYHVRGPYSQEPFLKYHFPNAAEAPPPAPPAPHAAIEPPPPRARHYTDYVNNVNEPRKLITAAPEPPAPSPPAKHAKADKADPWTISGKASKSSPFPAAAAADHWQKPAGAAPWASTAPARKENLWAAPAAVSTHSNAFWPATADTGKSDKTTGWGAPPKAAPPAPAFWAPQAQASAKTDQGHFWSPAPPAATKAQSKAEKEKEKARRAHADAVNQMDRSDPNGGAFYHGGPYERQTHGRTASQGNAGVRFDAGASAHYTPRQRPPSPTAQLDRFVAQVSQARHPAAFADLYERTASPPGAKGQKKKDQNQGKGKKGDVAMFGAPTFPASRFEQGAVSAAARHRARVEDANEDEQDYDDMPALVPQATSFWSGGSDVSRSTVQGHGFGQPQGKKGQYPGFR